MSSGLSSSDLPSTVDASARSARTASTRPGQSAGSTPTGDGPVFATEMKEALTAGESAPAAPSNTTSDPAAPDAAAQTDPAAAPGETAAQTALKGQGAAIKRAAPEPAVAPTPS